MFSSFKSRLLLGLYIFIILSIPMGAYLVSQNKTYKSSAQEGKANQTVKNTPKPASSPASLANLDNFPSPFPEASSPTLATSFGPTLSLKAALEGRVKESYATKLFVGIIEGSLSANPKFLLSFSVNLPQDGSWSNLSLAGLNAGTKYTALLKGSSQIATSSAFVMSPTVTNLNNGQALNMLTGDLNEDNVVNSTDYNIALKALGTTAKSANWNSFVDFNQDGLINLFDLALITKNIGQTGASGAWTSTLPKVSTPAASLTQSAIGSPDNTGGYWLWIPK